MRKAFAVVVFVVSLFVFAAAPRAMAAPASPALESTWVVDVIVDPSLPTGNFVALETYNRGGGLVTTNNIPRAAGIDVGHGAWERIGPNAYQVSIMFFVFNSDGSRAGSIEVSHVVTLVGADEYIGEGQASLRGTNGAVLATGAFRTTGRRLPARQF